MPSPVRNTEKLNTLLSLALNPSGCRSALPFVSAMDQRQREEFLSLAQKNHVVIRAFDALQAVCVEDGELDLADWLSAVLLAERTRIANALPFLESICEELEHGGCPTSVLKSLDHIPDMGNDLDLYTTGSANGVIEVMTHRFHAEQQPRSAGDRLANKLNFVVPGLAETVEIHVQRLGQAGEHTVVAQRFVTRRVKKTIGGHTFPVPAAEEKILAATFQRMYRHFFLRVCDVVNTAGVIKNQEIDFADLKNIACVGSIWPGVATYLNIVRDYVKDYRQEELEVPYWVRTAALFGNKKLFCTRGPFLRIPIAPQVARLYTSQLAGTAFGGHLSAALRLSLLPGLFSVAVLHEKLTGRDQGVW
jgi:hypothetical protein